MASYSEDVEMRYIPFFSSESEGSPTRRSKAKLRALALPLGIAFGTLLLIALTATLFSGNAPTPPPHVLMRSQEARAPKKGASLLEKVENPSDMVEAFEAFMVLYEKQYADDEEKRHRFEIFQQNLRKVHSHNKANAHPYTLGMNRFGDMTPEEFEAFITGYKRPESFQSAGRQAEWLLDLPEADAPADVDWREKGCVTPVKDQKFCGSCWAFSATGALEGQSCAKTGKLISLSEQELVDCSGPEGDQGCNGGLMDNAFQFVEDNKGLCLEEDYPYLGVQEGMCQKQKCKSAVKVSGYTDVPKESVKALKHAVTLKGPISVAVDADVKWQLYKGGMFLCAREAVALDHGVLLVGYGKDEESGADYWIVKNSWGPGWGEEGYIRIAMEPNFGGDGGCGILKFPSYPNIA